ncbi:MAG: PAS domain S-box protein [Desulfobacteraceae bacterium]|nr:MAG: PAS domain S-box protein [Desulfobacteraceae bacterium]
MVKNGRRKNWEVPILGRMLLEQLNAIIDSSFDGLWICDGEGRVVRINKASEEINDIRAEQVLDRKMEDLVGEGLIDRSVTLEVLKKRAAVTIIQKLRNGKQVLVTGNPVFDKKGDIRMVVVNDRDITELNKLRKELEESRALSRRYQKELSHAHGKKGLFTDVVVRSESMQRVFETAIRVAEVDSTVLIGGESGVGKGLVARLMHTASKRREGPFIRVDCGAIPEPLIESELFGYQPGAFTGALQKGKPGYFEMAEGGTLFLDEVGELPRNIQVKLLRFMEDNEVVRVGGTNPKRVDARIIAATHRDLKEMVRSGSFRKDLYFRLSVVPIQIPPLRERREDIPPLIHLFLQKYNAKCSATKVLRPRAVDLICGYSFPGNIRELSNLLEQLVVLSPHEEIEREDLPSHLLLSQTNQALPIAATGWNLRESVERLEKETLTLALRQFKSQRRAAGPLGLDQSTLARKIKKYGISSDAKVHHDAKMNSST